MSRLALVIVSAFFLAGCQHSEAPASVEGECHIFTDPGFPVRGERAKDQRWITKTQETGITGCGWGRPLAEEVKPALPPTPVASPTPLPTPADPPRWWKRLLSKGTG